MTIINCPVAFLRITSSAASGIFLSQAHAIQEIVGDGQWWTQTQAEWVALTGLTRRHQEGARAKLKALGILEEKREGIPARLYFRLNSEALAAAIAAVKQAA